MQTNTTLGLGPATVIETVADRVRLDRGGREAWAQLALAHPYRPEPGDLVLAIGEEEVYIIGVLLGRGKTAFHVQGDLELRATGRVTIASGEEVETQAPRVTVHAGSVETVAGASVERLETKHAWVADAVQTTAGRVRTVVEGQATLHAKEIVQNAQEQVKIDGRQILLG